MLRFHRPRNDADKSQLLGLFHLQSTPRKAEIVNWGYDWQTNSGRRDHCATALLTFVLVVCAITVSGFTSSLRLIYVKADLCKGREETLGTNLALMRNITSYNEARMASSLTVNLTATAYFKAKENYNSLGTSFSWPSPYDLSEEERQELETQAREGGDDCETVKDCVGGVVGWVGNVVGQKTCVEADVPCPDIEATELLVEYDASQKSLDLFGRNTTTKLAYNETLAQTALDQATNAISVLVRRVNFASSIYVLYLAFLVVVTPPFIVYGAKWNQRIFDFLANVNKPLWICLIVLVWYAHEAFQSIINSSLYSVIWANFLKDPCWADPRFLVNTSRVISETCMDITSAHNLFSQAGANYRYYNEVENTWQAAVADEAGGPFYGDPDSELISVFPGNCTPGVLLNAIQPSDGRVSWWFLFFRSGALVAIMLQFVLAHWFISWFSVLRPLTMHRGRVMVPGESKNDNVLYHEVRNFARSRAILPLVCSSVLLLFLAINLGTSSTEEGMGRNVLIGSFVVVFFQFVIVPALIWRKEDETSHIHSDKNSISTRFPVSEFSRHNRDDNDVDGCRNGNLNLSGSGGTTTTRRDSYSSARSPRIYPEEDSLELGEDGGGGGGSGGGDDDDANDKSNRHGVDGEGGRKKLMRMLSGRSLGGFRRDSGDAGRSNSERRQLSDGNLSDVVRAALAATAAARAVAEVGEAPRS